MNLVKNGYENYNHIQLLMNKDCNFNHRNKNKNMKSILKLLLLKCDLKIKNEFLLIEKEKYD